MGNGEGGGCCDYGFYWGIGLIRYAECGICERGYWVIILEERAWDINRKTDINTIDDVGK